MDYGEPEKNEPKFPKYRTLEGYFEDRGNEVYIFEKAVDPVSKFTYKEVKSITIKPAGTLFNGMVTVTFTNGASIKYGINAYQMQDLEEFKAKLGK